MSSTAIETLMFSPEMQSEFAKLSGDWNPMHMDSVAARRTMAGRRVVHGIHTVLRSLDRLASESPALTLPSKLTARFVRPIYLGEEVSIVQAGHSEGERVLQARVDGVLASELRIVPSEWTNLEETTRSSLRWSDDSVTCRELSLEELTGRSGIVSAVTNTENIATIFPHAVKWLGADKVGGLLCLSRLVGMECPGMHSLFSGFTVEFLPIATHSSLQYRVMSVDKRFRLTKMQVNGLGLQGIVEAFVRPAPIAQASMQELASLVEPDEFAGARALIVGGSRGLGELTAKILAAGGGQPIVTYAEGKEDAGRVAEEIRNWCGRCEILKFDVRLPAHNQLESIRLPIPCLYYYATNQIHVNRTKQFDPALLNSFLDFYVRGFYEVCQALHQAQGSRLSALYPSSIAVEERPKNMTEYAMAKAAAEVLCEDLNRSWRGMHITCIRLPRLLTDQTATVMPAREANPIDILLPIIRKVQGLPFRKAPAGGTDTQTPETVHANAME
jgi:NAD(P)-dependent dehydrogenase (short-subunit alcohol dehydrogenase family)